MARTRTKPINFKEPRYQRLRAAVFRRDGFTCQLCGWRPPLLSELDEYDGRYTIGWRDYPASRLLNVDHIIPRVQGGPSELENCQTLCYRCNSKKGARF